MRTIHDILQDAPNISILLQDHTRYWAHIHPEKPPESLFEHSSLVNRYFYQLIQANDLEKIIDDLITVYVKDWPDPLSAADYIKALFVHVIIFHDFGKINENFQVLRMQNTASFKATTPNGLQPPHGHSFLGTYLYLGYHIDLFLRQKTSDALLQKLIFHTYFLAYSILQHHHSILQDASSPAFLCKFNDTSYALKDYLEQYGIDLDKKIIDNILQQVNDLWAECDDYPHDRSFPLYALLRLNFSLLTAADYMATHEYMSSTHENNEGRIEDFGVLNSSQRIAEIIGHLQSFKHNKSVFSSGPEYEFTHPKIRSGTNLNVLRKEMAIELLHTVQSNYHQNLFYIEAPTGGGKTNLSMIAVTEILKANPEIKKIFYVFPFTTLISQTFSALKESLGLEDHEIAELHSKAAMPSRQRESVTDGSYGNDKTDYIDYLFSLYPITVMSHVKFFDILKTHRKEINYLLHRLANSIVVIDEIQSYNPMIWDKMLYFISQYALHFNIRFILMSATLPKISELSIGLTRRPNFVDLLPNARKYITNENFSKRVNFHFEYSQEEITIEHLAELVLEKSVAYIEKNGSVRTIVEFIYKRSASSFLQAAAGMTNVFDKIFILSGTILDPRRREIINFIKRTARSNINILLVTTQVVEAGVDIDMDLGFKNISLIDSDEQLGGRVNRNALKEDCAIYLFRLDNAKTLYGSDFRYQQTRENISQEDYQQILIEKDFKRLYEKVLGQIDKFNNPIYRDNMSGYLDSLHKLRFEEVDHNFKIINQENESVFVPLKIPLQIASTGEGMLEDIFSMKDLSFLSQFSVSPSDGLLDGAEVWKVYQSLIGGAGKEKRFNLQRHVDLRQMQGILSKFTFSLITHSKDYQGIRSTFGEEMLGYMYFTHWNEDRMEGRAYSYEEGLNSKAFNDANFI